MEHGQRGLDSDQVQQQQLKLRDRQKFFEEVFQHEVDFFFPMSHLQIEHRRRKCWPVLGRKLSVLGSDGGEGCA